MRQQVNGVVISLQRKIDMEEVLKYPLTPVPLSLCHADGKMFSTPKSKLMNEIETRNINGEEPSDITGTVVDGFFFLHLLVDPPSTFGLVSKYLLKKLCALDGMQIHFVLDKMISPSIKDVERNERANGNRHTEYQITGSSQRRPGDWLAALRIDSFKKTFVSFITNHWRSNEFSSIIGEKTIFVNENDCCYAFSAEDGIVMTYTACTRKQIHECSFI